MFFDNDEKKKFTFLVFDATGKKKTELLISENEIDIGNLNLQNGIYFFELVADDKVKYKGQIVIL